jgi:excisionase family DNA binding protein
MSDEIPTLLTLCDLAARLRVSTHTIRAWVRQGKLQPVRLCRRLLFHPEEVSRLLSEADRKEKAADSRSAARKG